jgi:HlyD family secretion protein
MRIRPMAAILLVTTTLLLQACGERAPEGATVLRAARIYTAPVEAPIDEVDAGRVRIGMPVRVSLDAFRGRRFAGQVSRIAPFITELEKQARTVNVEVRFIQLPVDVALLTGYSADVEILLEQSAGTLRIPTETLLEGRRVLRYDPATGLLNEVALNTGLANWRWTEVLGGLVEGERILASLSQDGLKDGAAVISSNTAESLR